MEKVRAGDREILRSLGKQVAEIAALPQQEETVRFWKAMNGLKLRRPMVMIDQVSWHEMNVNDELTLQTGDAQCRRLESDLRQRLYRWKHMRADYVVDGSVTASPVLSGTEFGLKVEEDRAVSDPQNSVVGHFYHDQIQTEKDLEKIKMPDVRHDVQATENSLSWLHDIFDGVMQVRLEGVSVMLNLWDALVMWRGAENVLMDLGERPEFIHQIMRKIAAATSAQIDQFERLGVLDAGQRWIHCTGAFTDELPASGFDPKKVRTRDVWACGMAQIFSSVSPAMHQEFELDYFNPLYARFGLVYYGCCEPLDRKLDIVKKIPNVRKISMSPWVDVNVAAEGIGRQFVFSRKPSPAFLAVDDWDPRAVEKDLRQTLDACKTNGCPVELILKDISTVHYQPQRLWEWCGIAMRLAEEYAS